MSWGEDDQGVGEWFVLLGLNPEIDETGVVTVTGYDTIFTPGNGYRYTVWTSPGTFIVG